MKDAREFERLAEKCEILLGERGSGNKPQAALRRGDLAAMQSMVMKSRKVAVAPTANDFNELRADIERLMTAMAALAKKGT